MYHSKLLSANDISSNSGLLGAISAVNQINQQLTTTQSNLSSGLRISSSSDSSKVSLSHRFESSVENFVTALTNANSAISLTQAAEVGLDSISLGLNRLTDLATQAAKTSLSSAERTPLESEAQTIIDYIENVVGHTNFEGSNLLSGSMTFNISLDNNNVDDITFTTKDFSSLESTLNALDFSSSQGGITALISLDDQSDNIAKQKTSFGNVRSLFKMAIHDLGEDLQDQGKMLSEKINTDLSVQSSLTSRKHIIGQANISEQETLRFLL